MIEKQQAMEEGEGGHGDHLDNKQSVTHLKVVEHGNDGKYTTMLEELCLSHGKNGASSTMVHGV